MNAHTQDAQLQALFESTTPVYAPPTKRALAWLIDTFLFIILAAILNTILAGYLKTEYRQYYLGLGYGISFALQALWYIPFFEARGGTLGKRLLGITSVSLATLSKPKYSQSLVRSLFAYWPVVIGILLNGSLIFYANAHTSSGEYERDLYESLAHPKEYDMNTEQGVKDYFANLKEENKKMFAHYNSEDKTTFVYNEPVNTNYFLQGMYLIFVFVGAGAAMFSPRKQTWGDRYAGVLVVKKPKK